MRKEILKSKTKNFIVLGIYQEKTVYYNNENHQLLYPTKNKTIGATAITGYSSIALILYSVLRSISEKRNVLILYITIICFLLIGIVTATIFISSGNYISLVLTLSSYFIVYTILNTKLIKRSNILRQLYKELSNKEI